MRARFYYVIFLIMIHFIPFLPIRWHTWFYFIHRIHFCLKHEHFKKNYKFYYIIWSQSSNYLNIDQYFEAMYKIIELITVSFYSKESFIVNIWWKYNCSIEFYTNFTLITVCLNICWKKTEVSWLESTFWTASQETCQFIQKSYRREW